LFQRKEWGPPKRSVRSKEEGQQGAKGVSLGDSLLEKVPGERGPWGAPSQKNRLDLGSRVGAGTKVKRKGDKKTRSD